MLRSVRQLEPKQLMTQDHHIKEDYSKTNMEINVFFF